MSIKSSSSSLDIMIFLIIYVHILSSSSSSNKSNKQQQKREISRCFYYYTVYYNLRNDRIRCCYSNFNSLLISWMRMRKKSARIYTYIYVAAEAAKQTASHTIPFIHVYMCVFYSDDDTIMMTMKSIRVSMWSETISLSLSLSSLFFSFGCRASHWEKKYREIPLSRLSSSSFRSFLFSLSSHYLLFQTTTTKLETKPRND